MVQITYSRFRFEKELQLFLLLNKGIDKFITKSSDNRQSHKQRSPHFNSLKIPKHEETPLVIKQNTLEKLDEMIRMSFYKNKRGHKSLTDWAYFDNIVSLIIHLIDYCKKNGKPFELYENAICHSNIKKINGFTLEAYKKSLYKDLLQKEFNAFEEELNNRDEINLSFTYVIQIIKKVIKFNKTSTNSECIEIKQNLVGYIDDKFYINKTKWLNKYEGVLKELKVDIFTEIRIKKFADELSTMTKDNIEKRKNIVIRILNLNFDNIKHFGKAIATNFYNFPKDIKNKIVSEIENPFIQQYIEKCKTFVKETQTNKLKEDTDSINKFISAIDFLYSADDFDVTITSLFPMLRCKKGDTQWDEFTRVKQHILALINNYYLPSRVIEYLKDNYPNELKMESFVLIKNLLAKIDTVKAEQLIPEILKQNKYNLIFILFFFSFNKEEAIKVLNNLTKTQTTNKQKINIMMSIISYLKINHNDKVFDLLISLLEELEYKTFENTKKLCESTRFPIKYKMRYMEVIIDKVMKNTQSYVTNKVYRILTKNFKYLSNEQKQILIKEELQNGLTEDVDADYNYYTPLQIIELSLDDIDGIEEAKEFFITYINMLNSVFSELKLDFCLLKRATNKINQSAHRVYTKILIEHKKSTLNTNDKIGLIKFFKEVWKGHKMPFFFIKTEHIELKILEALVSYYNVNEIPKLAEELINIYIMFINLGYGIDKFNTLIGELFIAFHEEYKGVKDNLLKHFESMVDSDTGVDEDILYLIIELFRCYELKNLDEKETRYQMQVLTKILGLLYGDKEDHEKAVINSRVFNNWAD
eukprot:GAHX01002121.1.p1 GENE.GAHX01002121.1~~GAHX01002121.1.p1  ORF type:complete len:814 (-),score=177.67 GAHX01002121.1:71-2512(-)